MTRRTWVDESAAPRSRVALAIGRLLAGAGLVAGLVAATTPLRAQEGGGLADTLVRQAQDQEGPAKLEADEIDYDPKNEVVRASGDVQVFFGGRVLRADELIYDAKNDEITARGAIRLVNPDGTVLVADEASFDSRIQDGLIVGAKAILSDGRSRLAAVEGRRVDGRFTQLSKAVFSPCEICEPDEEPLWRIRARRVIQDEEARDIIYEDAQLDVLGVPVFYTPYFRHADPSVKRRSGFLTPSVRSTSELGFTAQVPYYYTFAPNRDLTFTAYAATEDNPIAVGEYRALENYGRYVIGGSFTSSEGGKDDDGDTINEGFRGHFIGAGAFDAGNDFTLGFDALIASDDAYLRRYRFSNDDRASTRLYLERFRDDGLISAEGFRYQSFREDERSGDIPLVLPLVELEQFYAAPGVGGEIEVSANTLFLRRTDGRDVGRLSGALGWSRAVGTDLGLLIEGSARVRGDLYRTIDDPDGENGTEGRVLPLASLRFSYPLGMRSENASHVLEPIATLVYAPYGGNPDAIPNEDSLDVDLDELRIFDAERVTGIDQWEDGPRATVGVRYSRMSNQGWELDASIGQSYRLRESTVFSETTGLQGRESDVVGAMRFAFDPVFSFGHRYRIGTDLDVERYEAFGSATLFDRLTVQGAYVFAGSDPAVDSNDDRSEFLGSARLSVTETWSISGNLRRDLEEDRTVSAGAGIGYSDECADLALTLSRRFNDVDDAEASTDVGLKIVLKGLDAQAGPSTARIEDERARAQPDRGGVANSGCSRLPKAQ